MSNWLLLWGQQLAYHVGTGSAFPDGETEAQGSSHTPPSSHTVRESGPVPGPGVVLLLLTVVISLIIIANMLIYQRQEAALLCLVFASPTVGFYSPCGICIVCWALLIGFSQEAQRGKPTGPRPHVWQMTEPGYKQAVRSESSGRGLLLHLPCWGGGTLLQPIMAPSRPTVC